MYSMPLREGYALYQRFVAREADAVAEVNGLFPVPSECFACASAIPDDVPGLFVAEEPKNPTKTAIIAPLCAACMELPPLYRMARIDRMMRAMFGTRRTRMLKPSELRAIVGGPPNHRIVAS
jgi:hypothetical protein